jgi:acyl dehydratase
VAYEQLPEEVRKLIGQETERVHAPVAVERALIDHWVEVIEDSNPIYNDEEEAKKHGYKGLVAPPGMLLTWGQPFYWNPQRGKVDREKEGVALLHFKMKKLMKRPVGIVGKTEVEYYKPLILGDEIYMRERVVDVSQEKTTRVGTGNFWTIEVIYSNQKGEDVGLQRLHMFGYGEEEA